MKARKSKKPGKSARKTASASASKTGKAPARPAAVAREKPPARTVRLNIPPILLEGDPPPVPDAAGPGQRYALGPTPPAPPAAAPDAPPKAELPEAYGTEQLFLTARDPHWLFAHCDLTQEQLKKYTDFSIDRHVVLRVFRGALGGESVVEIPVQSESRDWFVPVPAAGAKYVAELGYVDAARRWVSVASSAATLTPPENPSDDTSVRFATIAPDVPFAQLVSMVKAAVRQHVPLVEAMQQMRAAGFTKLPDPEQVKSEWTPAHEKALAEVVSVDRVRRVWIGSLEITELIRRQLQQHVSSITAAQFSLPSAKGAVSSVSSPFGGERPGGFWFNVNAELIIYGATEPNAKVTIGNRPIKLRPDGTFSLRFALPDGAYPLPVVAESADGEETREARLEFQRSTHYRGGVGAHPQDQSLNPPRVSAVA
jgi:hypothetical protein